MSEIVKSIEHYLGKLKSRQTGRDAALNHFAYAEVPDWQLRQWGETIAALQPGGERERLLAASAITDRLIMLQIGTCSCDTKTPGIEHHDERCNYQMAFEAQGYLEALLRAPAPVAVTDEMVDAALDEAGSQWGTENTPENKRVLMRQALEAALQAGRK